MTTVTGDRSASPGQPKPDPILIADGIIRRFGGLVAVNVDHFEVQRNQITALIGPNGAGKTTFFNLLTGFDKPDGGVSTFDGQLMSESSAHKIVEAGHGPDVPAHQGAVAADRDREHAPRRNRRSAARRLWVGPVQVPVA